MEFRWDQDNDEPVLLLDGIVHEELPFISPDFKLDELKLPLYKTNLELNNVKITTTIDDMEWEPHQLSHKIQEKLQGDELTYIRIGLLSHESKVTNELLDLLANLKMPSDGLKKLHFENWKRGIEFALEAAVSDRLVQKSANLTELVITDMWAIKPAGKEVLADLAA